jgi:hypothetical protein
MRFFSPLSPSSSSPLINQKLSNVHSVLQSKREAEREKEKERGKEKVKESRKEKPCKWIDRGMDGHRREYPEPQFDRRLRG